MTKLKKKSLSQLVLENIMELERDKALLERIETRIEDRYIKDALKKSS